jgi:DNA-binding transcriptional MerR regulator
MPIEERIMNRQEFNQEEVNRIFKHIPARTLRQWALSGLYQWAGETEDGRGVKREYRLMHLYQIGIVETLAALNFKVEHIKNVMKAHFFKDENRTEKEILSRMDQVLQIPQTKIGRGGHISNSGVHSESFIVDHLKLDGLKFGITILIKLNNVKEQVDFFISTFA